MRQIRLLIKKTFLEVKFAKENFEWMTDIEECKVLSMSERDGGFEQGIEQMRIFRKLWAKI